jgi:hypothetical protein
MKTNKNYNTPACFLQILFITLLQLLLLPSYAQPVKFEWVRTIGAPGGVDAEGVSITLDADKAVVTAGNFRSTADFDPGAGVFNLTSNGAQDIFITKHDTAGVFKWAKRIGGIWDDYMIDAKFDNDGNLLLLVTIQGTVDVDPGPGVVNITNTGANGVLIKLDNDGNFIWAKHFLVNHMNTLEIDQSSNVLIAGGFYGSADFDPGPATYMATVGGPGFTEDMFVLKLDKEGNFIWMRQLRSLEGAVHQHFGLASDGENSIYFAGNFTSSIDFDPGTAIARVTSNGADDAFIVKLDHQGNYQWAKRWGASGSDKIFGLEVDNEGNVYSTGQFYEVVDFDPGPASFILSSPNTRCTFISRLDKNGNFIYAKNLQGGDSYGETIAVDSSKNVYVAGGFYGTIDFDPGAAVFNLTKGSLYTMKLYPDGSFAWAAGYISQTNVTFGSLDGAIAVDIFKNVYFTGAFPTTVDFDPGPSIHAVAPIGRTDVYILKVSQCHTITNESASFCSSYTVNGVTYANSGTYYQVFPISANCDSILALHLTRQDRYTTITATGCNTYNWNGKNLTSSGVYRDTISLPNGCDSIVQLNLTINRTVYTNLTETVCGSYPWKGGVLTLTGMYRDTIVLPNGCDSIVAFNLTVNPSPKPELGSDTTVCGGGSLILKPGSFKNYLWNNGSNANTLTISAPGKYSLRVTDNNNCTATDSITVDFGLACIECELTSETKLGPSPLRDWFVIYKNSTRCEVRMNVYSSLGSLVVKNKLINDGQNSIHLQHLSPGNYFYVLHSNGKLLKKGKIFKE